MTSRTSARPAPPSRKLLVSGATRRIPEIAGQLNEWQYMERSLHRLMAAWGAHHAEMEDKAALHRHVWDQAEIVRRLRDRVAQFPGGKPDAAVHPAFAGVAEAALRAPCFQDALDGIYHVLLRALVRAYAEHVQNAHPVHDGPTIALLHEINTIKELHFFWYREYRRRHPHRIHPGYRQALEAAIAAAHEFRRPMPAFAGEGAGLCGRAGDFSLPRASARPPGWRSRYDLMPYLSADFSESVEARRLFWAIGYLREINLPDDQLRWLFYGHDMPWPWHHDVSRHLWDESRHGLSGYSRLRDWGIAISDVGLPPYGGVPCLRHPQDAPLAESIIDPYLDDDQVDFLAPGAPMSSKDLYDAVFFIGMVAESGHFIVKNEAYDDFRQGGDFESAEMMLFDIIDETMHVQYAHRWLPLLAEKARIDNAGYRERAAQCRAEKQAEEMRQIEEARRLPRAPGYAPWDHYQDLLGRIRQATPFPSDFKPPARSPKPM